MTASLNGGMSQIILKVEEQRTIPVKFGLMWFKKRFKCDIIIKISLILVKQKS